MAYEIPQQLEYKEKIMFGLTFKQLAYAFLFGGISLLILKGMHFSGLGIAIAIFPAILGVCFIFFNLESLIKDYISYYKSRKIILEKKEVKDFMGIKDIKDDYIINSKNKKLAIFKINPLNFSIKPTDEKDSIISSFQKFLNALDFPTQLFINTEGIDIDKYLSTIKARTKNNSYQKLFDQYKKHLEGVVSNKKIMNRVFYLIIPEKGEISIQTSLCAERLSTLNLKFEQLKTKELEKLVQQFIPINELVNKEGKKMQGSIINNTPSHIEMNGQFHRIIQAVGYPRIVESGFLDKVVSLFGDFNISMHVHPFPIETMMININKELQKQRADLHSLQMKNIINPSLEIQHRDTRNVLEALQKGEEKLFNVSLYISCKAESLDALNKLSRKVEAELNSIMIMPKVPVFRMIKGLKSVLPLGMNELKSYRNVTTSALSAFFPFTSQFLQADDTGVWLGMNKNNIPIIKDIFKLPNPNGVVLAQSGGGKSYFCKLLITRYLLNGTKVMIIDPQGEYKSLVKRFNGQIIDLSRTSKTLINPLDLMGHDYTEKRLSLIDLMPIILGDLSEPQKAFLDKAITEAYSNKGINMDEETWHVMPPTLGDILESLKILETEATQIEKSTLRSLINRLEMYVTGVFRFLDQHTNIKFDNQLVCFDIGNMPKQVKPIIMFLVLDYVYMKMRSDIERKILLVDEAWSLLSRAEDAGYILEIVKTCRKFNMGLLLINQEVEDLFNSRAGKSVLANSAYTMLLRQKPSVINKVCESFHLSPSEREHLLTSTIGEGLLIMEDEHSKIKIVASPEEHKIITTNADEILKQKPTKKKDISSKPTISINVNLRQMFYKRDRLNEHEIKYLIKQGYQEVREKSIISNKYESYILKPRHNESIKHMFFTYNIAEFLEKNGAKVQLFTTKMPDIVFEIKGKKYAFEIETGTVIENKNRIKEKISLIKQQNYDGWFFIVTSKHIVKKYKSFGKTIDPRSLKGFLNRIVKK